MQTISLNSIAAPHMAASAIVGAAEPVAIAVGDDFVIIRDRDYTEMRFGATSNVTIERPSTRYGGTHPASVSWSSSSSNGSDAALTAQLLMFAESVRLTLDEWMRNDQLPYLKTEA